MTIRKSSAGSVPLTTEHRPVDRPYSEVVFSNNSFVARLVVPLDKRPMVEERVPERAQPPSRDVSR